MDITIQKAALGVLIYFFILTFMLCFNALFEAKVYRRNGSSRKFFHSKNYPEDYILPHRKIRKLFKMKHEMIPKWMYVRLLLVVPYVGIFLLACVIVVIVLLLGDVEVFIQTIKVLWYFYRIVLVGSLAHYLFSIFKNTDCKQMKKDMQEAFSTKNKPSLREMIKTEKRAREFLKEQEKERENKKKR